MNIGEGITLFQGSDQASWLNETDADTLLKPQGSIGF